MEEFNEDFVRVEKALPQFKINVNFCLFYPFVDFGTFYSQCNYV